MNKLELKIPPLLLWGLFGAAIFTLGRFLPTLNLTLSNLPLISLSLMMLGIGIMFAGVFEFRMAKTTMDPRTPNKTSRIVNTGIYRLTRNPMYLGMLVALAGLSLWHVNLMGFLFVLTFYTYITRFQIKPEERILLNHFGDEYAAYMAQVRRWL